MATSTKIRIAVPEPQSGMNPDTPTKNYFTHPNQHFKIGDTVIPSDQDDGAYQGMVIGHAAEDALWVQWPMIASQHPVDEVIKVEDWSLMAGLKEGKFFPQRQQTRPNRKNPKSASRRAGSRIAIYVKVYAGNNQNTEGLDQEAQRLGGDYVSGDAAQDSFTFDNPADARAFSNVATSKGFRAQIVTKRVRASDREAFFGEMAQGVQNWFSGGQQTKLDPNKDPRTQGPTQKFKKNPFKDPKVQMALQQSGAYLPALKQAMQAAAQTYLGAITQVYNQQQGQKADLNQTYQQGLGNINQQVGQGDWGAINQDPAQVGKSQGKPAGKGFQKPTLGPAFTNPPQPIRKGQPSSPLLRAASFRVNGVRDLRTAALLLEGFGRKRSANIVRQASDVALAIHELYGDPGTRKASSDSTARKAMNLVIANVLDTTERIRKVAKLRSLLIAADQVDAALMDAFTYPRTAAKPKIDFGTATMDRGTGRARPGQGVFDPSTATMDPVRTQTQGVAPTKPGTGQVAPGAPSGTGLAAIQQASSQGDKDADAYLMALNALKSANQKAQTDPRYKTAIPQAQQRLQQAANALRQKGMIK